MNELYNLRTEGDQYRITKWVDGNVVASYLCTETDCDCPAGVRPTCRHRLMLPAMLARRLCNTHWFWDMHYNYACDLDGNDKSLLDAVAEGSPAKAYTPMPRSVHVGLPAAANLPHNRPPAPQPFRRRL